MSKSRGSRLGARGRKPRVRVGTRGSGLGVRKDAGRAKSASRDSGLGTRGSAATRLKAAQQLSHVDAHGAVRMVDVSEKPVTTREAVARGRITMSRAAVRQIRSGAVKKGDPLQTARLAGIMAAKRTVRRDSTLPSTGPVARRCRARARAATGTTSSPASGPQDRPASKWKRCTRSRSRRSRSTT